MNTLVAKEAYKRGVKFTPLKNKRFKMSLGDYTYVVRKGRIVSSPNFGLATKVVTRKEVLNRILTTKGYNCPENAVFKKEDIDRAWNWAKPILPIVLKPARGQRGKSVFVNINEFREF